MVAAPAPAKPPRLVEGLNVSEIYADEMVGAFFVNGNFHLTFSTLKADHSKADPPPQERVICARLVLPLAGIVGMNAQFSKLFAQLETMGVMQKISTTPVTVQ